MARHGRDRRAAPLVISVSIHPAPTSIDSRNPSPAPATGKRPWSTAPSPPLGAEIGGHEGPDQMGEHRPRVHEGGHPMRASRRVPLRDSTAWFQSTLDVDHTLENSINRILAASRKHGQINQPGRADLNRITRETERYPSQSRWRSSMPACASMHRVPLGCRCSDDIPALHRESACATPAPIPRVTPVDEMLFSCPRFHRLAASMNSRAPGRR